MWYMSIGRVCEKDRVRAKMEQCTGLTKRRSTFEKDRARAKMEQEQSKHNHARERKRKQRDTASEESKAKEKESDRLRKKLSFSDNYGILTTWAGGNNTSISHYQFLCIYKLHHQPIECIYK